MTPEHSLFCPMCRAVKNDTAQIEEKFGSLNSHYEPPRTLAHGQKLFEEDQPSDRVYVVHTGEVKLSRSAPGSPQVLRLVSTGQVCGHRAVLGNEPYTLTAIANDSAEVCSVSSELFQYLLKTDPDFSGHILYQLSRTVRDAEDRIVSLAHDSVRRRCAKMLLYLRRGPETADTSPDEVRSGLRRLEMAQMIGTTPETLSRTLHSLARQQLIEISRTNIRIIDSGALERIAGSPTVS